MSNGSGLFHESWYRIAAQRLSLRPRVEVRRQLFRGERWYVVRDPLSHQFHRLRPAAYQFMARLDGERTVEQAWKDSLDQDPDGAPSQGDVIELLAQLHQVNLLHSRLPPDSAKLFDRYKKKKQKFVRSTLMNVMFLRIPLFDPHSLLRRIDPWVRALFSPWGVGLWAVTVAGGLKIAADHFSELRVQSQGVLAPSNLFLLYAGVVLIKVIHEFGHAFAVRRFGGEVHTMGVMFLIFSPLPYTDASDAWSFRNKWQRALVGASGMIFEVFLASLAIFVWANTGPGTVHSLAYNMLFTASVSTLLFNLNPLLRWDGYYILSDLLNMPNLHQRAFKQLLYWMERHAFGCQDAENPSSSRREAAFLTGFGAASGIYRVFVSCFVLLFVADRFLLLGLVMAAVCSVLWVATPLVGAVRYLAGNPRLHRVRSRAVAVSAGVGTVLVLFFGALPFPRSFKAPGILKAVDYQVISNRVGGAVEEVLTASGGEVRPGDVLVRLSSPELSAQIRECRAGLEETRVRFQKAMRQDQSDLKPLTSRLEYFTQRLGRLEQQEEDLLVKSPTRGIWVAPQVKDWEGLWIARGTPLGQIVNPDQFNFVSVVAQEDVTDLFSAGVRNTAVKLFGQAGVSLPVTGYTSIPLDQTQLPSMALGWAGGGEIPVDVSDTRGATATEPFYEVRARVDRTANVLLLHGRTGKIRFGLKPAPLMPQGWRRLRQLVQKRYEV